MGIRKVKLKTALRVHLILVSMAIIKKTNAAECLGKNHYFLLLGM